MNPVERRILELSSFQLGNKKKYIRAVRRKVVVPNRRYSWMLFEHAADTEPVEAVVLDVNLAQALEIDRTLQETLAPAAPDAQKKAQSDCGTAMTTAMNH